LKDNEANMLPEDEEEVGEVRKVVIRKILVRNFISPF